MCDACINRLKDVLRKLSSEDHETLEKYIGHKIETEADHAMRQVAEDHQKGHDDEREAAQEEFDLVHEKLAKIRLQVRDMLEEIDKIPTTLSDVGAG